jgi:hypothetical protein
MTDEGKRSSLFSVMPNWVSAIAAALAALAAIVFGIVELSGDDGDTAGLRGSLTSTSTSESQGPIPISEADLRDVGDNILRVHIPAEWDERRSYSATLSPDPDPDLAAARIPTHAYAAAEAAEDTGIEFYESSGFFANVSTHLDALPVNGTSSSDEVVALLGELYPFGHDCDPQLSTRQVSPRSYDGVLRDWRGCGEVGARFTDGLLFADDGSHFVYVQLRAPEYEWEAAVDEVLSSIDVDVDALAAELGDEVSLAPSTEGSTP